MVEEAEVRSSARLSKVERSSGHLLKVEVGEEEQLRAKEVEARFQKVQADLAQQVEVVQLLP